METSAVRMLGLSRLGFNLGYDEIRLELFRCAKYYAFRLPQQYPLQ